MSSIIRLDAIPIPGLPQIVKSDPREPSSTKVNCVLHCEPLPAHQHLEVSINGVLLQGVAEGDQIVFSWQLMKASDDVRIKLFKRGVVMKYWQGCWNERDALLHLGTLPVQVFFDGKPQPPGGSALVATLEAMQRVGEGINHNGHTAVVSRAGDDNEAHASRENENVVVVQDLAVIAVPHPSLMVPQPDYETTEGEPNEFEHDGQEEEEESDGQEEDRWDEVREEDETDEFEHDGQDEEEDLNVQNSHEEEVVVVDGQEEVGVEDEKVNTEESEPVVVLSDPHAVDEGGDRAQGPRIAAFHANPLAAEETLEALKGLMETMPPKTIILDLRRHSKTRKRDQGQSELSKDRLRAIFGGKYWDRGWAIQTSYQRDASVEAGLSSWQQILVDPDGHQDGIPSFVEQLQAGYSVVVMDGSVSYTQSPRRAVIEELQKRVSNLVVGPVG